MKNNQGFTLVEVIVTAVIVAILAAVTIPLYTSYITNARQDTVNNLAETASAAANAFFKKTNTDPTLAQLNLFYNPGEFTIAVNAPSITVTNSTHTAATKTVTYR